MKALLTREMLSDRFEWEEGDAGIVLKKDGTFRVVNTHQNIDPKNLTPRQIEQTNQLLALAAVLRVPSFMQTMLRAASDPEMFEHQVEPINHH